MRPITPRRGFMELPVAMKVGRIRAGKVLPQDERIVVTADEDVVWIALDEGNYEIRFDDTKGSPFRPGAKAKGKEKDKIGLGQTKKIHKNAKKTTYKYSVYTDGQETHDPDVVVV
jgi:hypothetical protein